MGKTKKADLAQMRRRYATEREKRLRSEANEQFTEVSGAFAHYADDPHAEPIDRAARREEVDVAVLGTGFGGLLVAGRLRELGIERILLIDKAGDVGGTWYWNRYPGAQCDVESYIYFPLLEETGYMPREKYSYAPEIREHARRISDFFGLRDSTLSQTEVTKMTWDEPTARWIVETDRGDRIHARFVCTASGPLHRPKLPGIPGLERYRGHAFHTSRWDYDYTGGSEEGGMTKLARKRVGVIGTGCTALQIVPRLAEDAGEVLVFQRTPSTVAERNNRPTDPEWAASLKPGWQRTRMQNFNNLTLGLPQDEDLVADDWTDLTHRTLAQIAAASETEEPSAARIAELAEEANLEKMEVLRARVESTVDDPTTAEALKPYYRFLCKRPGFHDEYLATFNRSNVTLVDTEGRGVERVTEQGVVVDGREYPVDCLIYATGLEVGTAFTRRAQCEILGRSGRSLSEHWATGMRTLHSFMTDGFPNLFILSPNQGGQSFNFTHTLDEISRHIASLVDHMTKNGLSTAEPTMAAVDGWVKTVVAGEDWWRSGQEGCTPGYLNNEGDLDGYDWHNLIYSGGAAEFFALIESWREAGEFEGLHFERESGRVG